MPTAKRQKPQKAQKRKSKKLIQSPASFLPDESIRTAPDYPYLLKSLENASPGQLFFLRINSPLKRKHLPKLLEADGVKRPYAIADFAVLPKDIPPYQVLREFLKDISPCEILYVDGLEHIIEASPKIGGALEALVMGREILANLGVTVVFLLPLYLMNLIRNHALNLWIWRAHDYNLDPLESTNTSGIAIPSFGTHTIARNDTPESRERRIRILQRLLEEGVAENRSMVSLLQTVIYPLANDLYDAGRYNETTTILLKALKSINNADSILDNLPLFDSLARVLWAQGKYKMAENALKCLEPIYKKLDDNDSEHLEIRQQYLNGLATIYSSQGRNADAKTLYQQALDIGKKLYGEEDPSIPSTISNMASIYEEEGHYAEAEKLRLQAFEIMKKLLGEEHPDVATGIKNLGVLYGFQGRYAEAEPLFLQALEMNKKLLGQEHPDIATNIEGLAHLYGSQGRFAEAEPLHLQALEMRKKLLGHEHPAVAGSLYNLAVTYYRNNDFQKAEPLMADAFKLCKQLLGKNHPYTINVSKGLQLLRNSKKREKQTHP